MTSLSENTVVSVPGGLIEVARVTRNTEYTISATSTATAADVFSSHATFVADGSSYYVDFYAPEVYSSTTANSFVYVDLVNSAGTKQTTFGAIAYGDGTRRAYDMVNGRYVITPTAGSVVSLNVRAYQSGGNGAITTGAGNIPATMTVNKIVQASQFIVPLASAPLVTSLPSTGNIDGQEVRYLVDDTNGTIWNLRWRTSANRWEPISGFESDRNRIINGAMLVDQRRAYVVANSQTDVYVSDRFRFLASGGGNANVQTVTNDGPTGVSRNSAKITVATQDTSLAAGDYYLFRQGIEGNLIQDLGFGSANTPITISFYVKSSVTGLFGGSIRNPNDTRCYVYNYTINAANTWERKIISLTVDNTGTYGTGTDLGLYLVWSLGHGANATSSTTGWQAAGYNQSTGCTNLFNTASATWQISGVQLEIGPTATPFQTRDIETELGKCQRYFERMGLVSNAAGADYQNYFYNTTKRVAPTSYTWYSAAPSPNGTPNFRDKNYFTLDGRSTVNTGHDLGVSAEIS
jgi:hypothetical protein